jgi:hypothetical protein
VNWLSLVGSPLAKEGLPILGELASVFKGDSADDESFNDRILELLQKLKPILPVLKAAKQVKAVDADPEAIAAILRLVGVEPTSESVSEISALIPQFARDPEQTLLQFATSGKFIDMIKHKIHGGTAANAHGVEMCPHCGVFLFSNIHKELK